MGKQKNSLILASCTLHNFPIQQIKFIAFRLEDDIPACPAVYRKCIKRIPTVILFGLEASEAMPFGLPAHDFIPRTIEERLVPLVGLMVEGDQPTTHDLRFSSLRKRYIENGFLMNRLDRAR